MDIKKMKAEEPETAKINNLVDISSVEIDISKPQEERVCDFISQIKNPYLYRCGDLIVKSVFAETDIALEDKMKQYFRLV